MLDFLTVVSREGLAFRLLLSPHMDSVQVDSPGRHGEPTALDAALAAGDLRSALRAWQEAYGASLGGRRWEGFADAGDAYLRIARASGSPADDISRARDLYLSALVRASRSGSLDGVLRLASAFVELGDDEIVTHSLRIARRLAAAGATLDGSNGSLH